MVKHGWRGFTLIELLVVIVIVAILLATALPTFFSQQQKAKDIKAKSYLSYAVRSFHSSETDKGGAYPPSTTLLDDLTGSEPELTVSKASGWASVKGAPANTLVIDTAKTTASQVVAYVDVPGGTYNGGDRIWQVVVPSAGEPIFSLVNTSFGGYYNKVVYTSAGNIVISDQDGSNLSNSSVAGQYPIWSPDGSKILYLSGSALKTMNPDGTGQATIPNTTSPTNWGPSASFDYNPGMSKIAYSGFYCCSSYDGIYTINPDGSANTFLFNAQNWISWLAFSADGQWIYFRRGGSIEKIKADGSSGSTAVTVRSDSYNIFDPALSPDRSKIVFDEGSGSGGTTEIYVMNADGSSELRLTNNAIADNNPGWTADGKITFSEGGTRYQINADGSGLLSLAGAPSGSGVAVCCGS